MTMRWREINGGIASETETDEGMEIASYFPGQPGWEHAVAMLGYNPLPAMPKVTMVPCVIYLAGSGEITFSGLLSSEIIPTMTDPVLRDVVASDTQYVVEGALAERPATGLPATHALAVGQEWQVPNVPAGTRVLIDGGEVPGQVDATGLVLEFPLAGSWSVALRPPWPWLAAACSVEVT